MTGTLQVKNGKYYCVLDYRDENGARKRKWINTKLDVKGNKKKATEILNKIILEYENKTDLEKSKSNNIFFTDYMLQWLEKKKNKVEITTWDGYYNTVVKHLVPYFEPLKLSLNDLKPKHVVDYYEYKFSSGRKDHKKGGLSMGSLKKHSVILKNILNNAFLEELINRNPALKIPLPKKENEESRCKFLNAKEANDLLKIFKEHRLQPLIYMTLYYGLRRGEAIGLKWSAIDFKNNTVLEEDEADALFVEAFNSNYVHSSKSEQKTISDEDCEKLAKLRTAEKRAFLNLFQARRERAEAEQELELPNSQSEFPVFILHLSIAAFIIFLLLFIYYVRTNKSFQKVMIITGMICTLVLIISSSVQVSKKYAIFKQSSILSVPEENATSVNELASGTRVRILEETEEWSYIEIGETGGWVKKDRLCKI